MKAASSALQAAGRAQLTSLPCRYGYDTAEYYTYVISQYQQAGIPLETFVADSQYMNKSQIWTLGSNFSASEMQVCCRAFA